MFKTQLLILSIFTFYTFFHLNLNAEPLQSYKISLKGKTKKQKKNDLKWFNQQGIDVAGVLYDKEIVELLVTQKDEILLKNKGYQRINKEIQFSGPGVNRVDPRYLNHQKLENQLKNLALALPEKTHLEIIGRTHLGRPIYAFLISNTNDPLSPAYLAKPTVLFDGMHHAREIMTTEIVYDVADFLVKGLQEKKPDIDKILTQWNVWVIPMLNVDGNEIVWNKNNMWRKNAYSKNKKVLGVDPNRNYGYRWNDCNGSSGNEFSQTYRGPSAESEPEISAIISLSDRIRPTVSLSYHSYSELILYPFSCGGAHSGENELMRKLAVEFSQQLPSDSGRGYYTPGTPWEILYPVDGDSMSFMHAAYGALAYTLEVNREFQPSYDQRNPTVNKHRSAWSWLLSRVGQNLLKIRVTDRQKRPIDAEIKINTIAHEQTELPFQTNSQGYFFKVLDPGSYQVKILTKNKVISNHQVTMNGSQTLDVVIDR